MPDPHELAESISGFQACPREGQTLWKALEERNEHYSLMNVAFRKDPVWTDRAEGLDIGCDGYRLWKKSAHFNLERGSQDIQFGGIELRAKRTLGGVRIDKGARTRACLSAGEGRIISLTRGLHAYACLLNDGHLVLSQLTMPMVRGGVRPSSLCNGFLDLSVFTLVRKANGASLDGEPISIDAEMGPSLYGMRQKENLILEAMRGTKSKLIIGYLPLIDEFNHAYMDLLETEWPEGRVSDLFSACMRSVDGLLGKVMAEADPDTLLVVSSDHGAVPFRRALHVNELLAGGGLVRRSDDGYDLRGSSAFYHPSNCGLVAMQRHASRPDVLRRLRQALDAARVTPGMEIGMVELQGSDPYPAFLYPLTDSELTGKPPQRGGVALDAMKAGGHHLSSLTPTPWIQATLGLWSPRSQGLGRALADIPSENRRLKAYLLDLI